MEHSENIAGIPIDDIMKEIGSMAAGNATVVLSNFFMNNETVKKNIFNKNIEIMPTEIKYLDLVSVKNLFSSEQIAVGYNVNLNIQDSTCNTLILFPRRTSLLIPMLIRGKYINTDGFVNVLFDEDISVILLISSIISNSYVETIQQFLEIVIKSNYANLILLQEKDVFEFLQTELGNISSKVISVKVEIHIQQTEFRGTLYFLLVLDNIKQFAEIIKSKWQL